MSKTSQNSQIENIDAMLADLEKRSVTAVNSQPNNTEPVEQDYTRAEVEGPVEFFWNEEPSFVDYKEEETAKAPDEEYVRNIKIGNLEHVKKVTDHFFSVCSDNLISTPRKTAMMNEETFKTSEVVSVMRRNKTIKKKMPEKNIKSYLLEMFLPMLFIAVIGFMANLWIPLGIHVVLMGVFTWYHFKKQYTRTKVIEQVIFLNQDGQLRSITQHIPRETK